MNKLREFFASKSAPINNTEEVLHFEGIDNRWKKVCKRRNGQEKK